MGEKRREEILADLWGTEDTGRRKKRIFEKVIAHYTLPRSQYSEYPVWVAWGF